MPLSMYQCLTTMYSRSRRRPRRDRVVLDFVTTLKVRSLVNGINYSTACQPGSNGDKEEELHVEGASCEQLQLSLVGRVKM